MKEDAALHPILAFPSEQNSDKRLSPTTRKCSCRRLTTLLGKSLLLQEQVHCLSAGLWHEIASKGIL